MGLFTSLPVVAPAVKRIVLCESFITGIQQCMQTHWQHGLHAGSHLEIRRETDNPRDPQALAFYTRRGVKLGYFQRAIGAFPALLMDQGLAIRACILSANPGAPLRERFAVRLFLDFPA